MRTLLLTLRLVLALRRVVQAYQQFQLVQSYDLFAASLMHILDDETKRRGATVMNSDLYADTISRVRYLLETLFPERGDDL